MSRAWVENVNGAVWLVAITVLLVSCWNRNDIPHRVAPRAELAQPPAQAPTARQPFSVDYAGVRYDVDPVYEYDLYGMVVSMRRHDGRSLMHRRANDYLNVADFCVVWGGNLSSRILSKLRVWNGIFSCNIEIRDAEAQAGFRDDQVSNNHLLSNDGRIRKKIAGVKVGDQVRVKGWLAHYGAAGNPKRGTSTTRTDTGDRACETIFVDRFDVLDSPFHPWRSAMYLSLTVAVLSLIIHFFLLPVRAPR